MQFYFENHIKMHFRQLLLISIIFIIYFDHGDSSIVNGPTVRTIVVDKSGHGDFTSVQRAIDSVLPNNDKWIHIFVKPGQYKEQVKVPLDRTFILLEGSGRKVTEIAWDGHNGTEGSSTFTISAPNFVAKRISFVNTYNHGAILNANPLVQAVAVSVFSDKVSFYECGFFGLQDTLCDFEGRHYFYQCYIEGAIDFIFGQGQSMYEGCDISVIADGLQGSTGYITAQGRRNSNDPNGYVFKNCNVFGNGKAYLGRPWGPYARVLFYKTKMTDVVHPQGWSHSPHYKGFTSTFAEIECFGGGSSKSKRVSWGKKPSQSELTQLSTLNFINKDHWIEQQP